MIKIIHEFNMKTFEDKLNEWIKLGYEISDVKVLINPNGNNASWIAILKKNDLKGE